MNPKKIFITGAGGCVGSYILDMYAGDPEYDVHLLLRKESTLHFPEDRYQNITIHRSDILQIENLKGVISQMEYVVHIATTWGDGEKTRLVNVEKTHALFDMCDPKVCKRIVYFSTSSILGKGNQPIPEAGEYGSGYVRTKYHAYKGLDQLAIRDKIITVFPTLVFGGDRNHPYSHISEGIWPNRHYLKILRFFTAPFSFHFMHSADIAKMTHFLLFRDVEGKNFVLGNPKITAKEAIRTLCKVFNVPLYFQIPIYPKLIFWIAERFGVKIGKWEKYLIHNPHFDFDAVSPKSFGLTPSFPNMTLLLEDVIKQAPYAPTYKDD